MTPTQPPAAGLDLDALEEAMDTLAKATYRTAAMRRPMAEALPALIARAREAEALRAEVERLERWQAEVLRVGVVSTEQYAALSVAMGADARIGSSRVMEAARLLQERAATIAELRAALGKALDIADEGWAYAEDYFRDKHLDTEQMARLRALANPNPTEGA